MASRAMNIRSGDLDAARESLKAYAKPLCKTASETGLPPLRVINHTIPLIDENAVYPWRPARCPEAFRQEWAEKRDAYLKTGRWKITNSRNTVPMMLIPKPARAAGEKPSLRTVIDLRARNNNTIKMTSPLPDPEGILRRAAAHPFRSSMDGKDAYEQIRIEPSHVDRTAVTTPDGNMVSLVIQIGDCNAPATYQSLMNHIFSPYIGRFMDVYLDDIIIYSSTLEDHITHVKIIIDILTKETLAWAAWEGCCAAVRGQVWRRLNVPIRDISFDRETRFGRRCAWRSSISDARSAEDFGRGYDSLSFRHVKYVKRVE